MELSFKRCIQAETAHLYLCYNVILLQIKASIYLWTMLTVNTDVQAITESHSQKSAERMVESEERSRARTTNWGKHMS